MIITLSPAKIIDFESEIPVRKSTVPIFEDKATELNSLMKSLSIEEVSTLMSINPQLAQNTMDYIHSFDPPKTKERQAVFVYNGIAYQGLDAATLSEEDLAFAQDHLVLMSGLYGALRPLDAIRPYRLEMQAKLANSKGKSLYNFWSDTLTQYLSERLAQYGNVWINLSSNEYSKVINKKKLPKGCQIITPVFKEAKGNEYKQVTVYAKKARGMMARFIIQHKIENIEYLKAFDSEGYSYSEQMSDDKEWVFIR